MRTEANDFLVMRFLDACIAQTLGNAGRVCENLKTGRIEGITAGLKRLPLLIPASKYHVSNSVIAIQGPTPR
jgi:hypothetical protein